MIILNLSHLLIPEAVSQWTENSLSCPFERRQHLTTVIQVHYLYPPSLMKTLNIFIAMVAIGTKWLVVGLQVYSWSLFYIVVQLLLHTEVHLFVCLFLGLSFWLSPFNYFFFLMLNTDQRMYWFYFVSILSSQVDYLPFSVPILPKAESYTICYPGSLDFFQDRHENEIRKQNRKNLYLPCPHSALNHTPIRGCVPP